MEARNGVSCPAASSIGPYKATRLWNDTITAFRQGVPRGKHRRFMRTAEDCFLGSTAVDWLWDYLKKRKEFGSDVTRQQTTHLLNKFYKAGIFEEIQLSRRGHNKPDFSDSNRLYRLLPLSPSKGTRVPLSDRTTNTVPRPLFKPHKDQKQSQELKGVKTDGTSVRNGGKAGEADADFAVDRLPQCHLVGRFLTGSQIHEIWKTAALSRLKKMLGVGSLDEILQDYAVDGGHVRHNCIFLNKSGIVTNIQPEDQLPHWVLSAMKCLARWPEKVEVDLPSYPGFEKDVFGVVRDYFLGLSEPLITYELYDVIINVFVQACNQLPRHSSPFSRDEKRFGYSLWSDSSLENVILNLTRKYCMTDSKTDLYSLADSRPDLFSTSEGFSEQFSHSGWFSGTHSQTGFADSQSSGTFGHRQQTSSYRDLHSLAQSQGDLQHRTCQTSSLPRRHAKSHMELFSQSGPCMASSQGDLRPVGASTGNLPGGHSVSNLHVSQSSQHLAFPTRASSQSTLGKFPDSSSFKDSKQFCSNPDLQVSRFETAFGPENQTVTRVYYCNGMATDFHHSSAQEQEELSPVETHFDVNTDNTNAKHQPTHISFERINGSSSFSGNKSGNLTRGSDSLRSSAGRSRSYNSYQRQQRSSVYDSSAFTSSSEPVQQESRLGDTNGRKPPMGRRGRGERHSTFSGSQFALGQENERAGLEDEDRRLSVSTPYLPGLKLGGDNQKTSTGELESGPRTTRSQGLSSGQRGKRCSSLYLNIPQSGLQEERATKALQIVCLFLPPASRRKLHFLLKLMSKMAANPFLTFDPSQTTRSLVLGTFQHAVLRAPEETADLDTVLVFQLVAFLVDHHMDIMAVPTDMKQAVEDRLRSLEKPQIVYSPRDPCQLRFTKPLSSEQYEASKRSHSHSALLQLLDSIVRDENMPDRERRRRLKQFQKTYPQMYKQRFPDPSSDPLYCDPNLRGRPPLLSRPLQKLRGLRV